MIYFTSDLHFFHENAIKFGSRPYRDWQEMNEGLIENWNRTVGDDDEIYILGDLTMKGPQQALEVIRRLHGKKYMIRGNHDHFLNKATFDAGAFEWIGDYRRLVCQGQRIILFHYPIAEWDQKFRGAIHLHGHQHNPPGYNLDNRKNGIRRYDVGVDANNWRPVSIEEILNFFDIAAQPFCS